MKNKENNNNNLIDAQSSCQNSVHRFSTNYCILNELGRGAFSIVYRAKSIKNGKIYCVKKIKLSSTNEQKNQAKTNEITVLKKLQSQANPSDPLSKNLKHLVQYYDSYIEDGYLYIIMEYCEYGDLFSLLHSVQKYHLYIQEDILWDISYQSLLGLEYLHSRNIIHRDIKLLNIFMAGDKTIKIGDMGMSKLIEQDINLMNMSRVGTPLFLAPELVKKEKYDYKIDIWSLGCSLYHLAKLVPPFNEENLIKLGNAIVNSTPKDLPDVYSNDFRRFVNALLVKNKDQRVSAREAIDKFIPLKVKNKYKEKHKDKNIKAEPPKKEIMNLSKKKVIDSKNESNQENTIEINKNDFKPSNTVLISGMFLKKQLKSRPFIKRSENNQIRHSYMKFNTTSQEMFPNNTKQSDKNIHSQIVSHNKIQTCNNFYNFNMNLFKLGAQKTQNVIPENEKEIKKKETDKNNLIFPLINTKTETNKVFLGNNFGLNLNHQGIAKGKLKGMKTPFEMRKTFNNILNSKHNKVLTIYDLK